MARGEAIAAEIAKMVRRTVVDNKIFPAMTPVDHRPRKTMGSLVEMNMVVAAKMSGATNHPNTGSRPKAMSEATNEVQAQTTLFIEAVDCPPNTAAIVMWSRIGVATN